MVDGNANNVRDAYDRVADEYVRRIYDELRHKPLDCALLDQFAASIPSGQLVCDLGCGPGHVGRYLKERGLCVCGVDLSKEMVSRARKLNPGIEFSSGDMQALPVPDEAWGGIVAFYAIVNLPNSEVGSAFREMWRVLRPGGLLLVSFHIGDEVVHLSNWWDIDVSIDFHFFPTELISNHMRAAGFEVKEITEREPYPDVEHPSRRAYILARRP